MIRVGRDIQRTCIVPPFVAGNGPPSVWFPHTIHRPLLIDKVVLHVRTDSIYNIDVAVPPHRKAHIVAKSRLTLYHLDKAYLHL